MGKTRMNLKSGEISTTPIFSNRFVVEICEKVHTHYKNLRIVNTISDWVSIAEGFSDALHRWKKRGCPGTGAGKHIELCRKTIYSEDENHSYAINLNDNLYVPNKDRIYSEGANFDEPTYIHVKWRDLRLEMSIQEFKEFVYGVGEAKRKLDECGIPSSLQEG